MVVTELRRGFAAGESYASVACEAEVGEQAVRYLPERLGLRERLRGEDPSRGAPIMALNYSDIPLIAIARALGVEAQTIRRAAIAYGLLTDEPGRCALMESRR
ncbi:hypothetical protein ACQKJ1_01455 [Methylorubrum rhodesianum]|uniref:hypothetical protein n=1 Tax=Methylorubrum rhodesianum TaxID=29427 RepID=UPI003CFD30BF